MKAGSPQSTVDEVEWCASATSQVDSRKSARVACKGSFYDSYQD